VLTVHHDPLVQSGNGALAGRSAPGKIPGGISAVPGKILTGSGRSKGGGVGSVVKERNPSEHRGKNSGGGGQIAF
jgi:hypothetical protein